MGLIDDMKATGTPEATEAAPEPVGVAAKQAAFDHMREQVAETQARFDAQHPRHYAGTDCTCAEAVQSMVEVWPETDPMVLYWCMSAFKYLWRWPNKGGTQDLRKAVTCLNYAIGRLED